MIEGRFHVEINGVKYRLWELENGNHYQKRGEPLRPPHAVVEQTGDPYNPRYQMRPDLMVWGITDWSGGEGQLKLLYNTGDRHWRLNCVEPFEYPGKLMPGPYVEETVDSGGTNPLEKSLSLVAGGGFLWGLDMNDKYIYKWDATNKKWGAAVECTGATYGATATAAGHAKYVIWKENGNDNIWKYDGSTFTKINDDTNVTGTGGNMYRVGHYAYLHQQSTGRVWEIDLEAASFPADSTLIYDPKWDDPDVMVLNGAAMCAPGDNCLYHIMSWTNGITILSQIMPTTAAGVGYGKELLRITGFIGESVWYHSGIVYFSGYEDVTSAKKRAVLYLRPGGEYGTLGPLRQGDEINSVIGGPHAQRMLDFGYSGGACSTTLNKPTLFLASAVTGGQCVYGYASVHSGTNSRIQSVIAFDGEYFFSTRRSATTKRVFRTVTGKYDGTNSFAISSWHDFALVDEKVLESIRLHCEALPTDWSIAVAYAINGSTSFTTAGTYATAAGSGTTYVISTSAAAVNFRSLQLKITFTWGGAGIPTTRPVVLALEARASAAGAKGPTVWKLLLDCADDASQEQGQSYSGKQKIDNLATAYATGVVAFKDGYTTHGINSYSTHSVIMDEYTLDVERPGEGQAYVTLREVT